MQADARQIVCREFVVSVAARRYCLILLKNRSVEAPVSELE
jgi:hypothetical protein